MAQRRSGRWGDDPPIDTNFMCGTCHSCRLLPGSLSLSFRCRVTQTAIEDPVAGSQFCLLGSRLFCQGGMELRFGTSTSSKLEMAWPEGHA